MKKETLKNFHHGFTLIELMIVIVILGILMGTILPRLAGAQGRARDLGRRGDLNNIATALESYYNDHSAYPTAKGCLIPKGETYEAIKSYLKGNKVPRPPTKNEVSGGCKAGDKGYYYKPIISNGVPAGGFILVADMEIPQNANALWSDVKALTTYDNVSAKVGTNDVKIYEDKDNAGNGEDTVFVFIQ